MTTYTYDARRCNERTKYGTNCRNRTGGNPACRYHRDTAALRAEVGEWCRWTARAHGVGFSDGEHLIGDLVDVKGDLCDWPREALYAALDAAVGSLGVAR
jgi:hypothetical protein